MKIIRIFLSCFLLSACATAQSRSEIAARFNTMQGMDMPAKLKECEAIATEYPENAYGRYCAGFIAEERDKDTAAAKQQYSEAMIADPSFEQAYVARGNLFAAENKHADAGYDFEKASQLNPSEPNHAFMAGWMFTLAQNWESAAPHLQAYVSRVGKSKEEKYLTAAVLDAVVSMNVFDQRWERANSKAVQSALMTEAVAPENNFCIKFKNLEPVASEIKKYDDLVPPYEHLRKAVPTHIVCKFHANLAKDAKKPQNRKR